MSELFRSFKTKNTNAEVSEVETKRLKETYLYHRLSVESPGKVPRRSLESVTTQQTTLNRASLIRVPTM